METKKETEAKVLSWERIGIQWVMGVRGEYSQGLKLCPDPRVRLLREKKTRQCGPSQQSAVG